MGYTKDEMREYQAKWIADRRNKYLRNKKCLFCDAVDDLMFHHINPDQKESHRIWSWSTDRLEAELAKCVVMCRQCHEKMHRLMELHKRPLVHGTMHGYATYGCRCKLCRAANAARRQGEHYSSILITKDMLANTETRTRT